MEATGAGPDSLGENRITAFDIMPRARICRFSPSVFGFPDKLVSRVRYHSIGSITSTSGALGTYVFRLNSTFDPDATGGGHQPLYRDTFAAIYDHYSVISSVARIRFQNGTSAPFLCGATIDDDTSAVANIDNLCEQTHGYQALLTPLSGSKSSLAITVAWDCKKVLGINPYASETYKTPVGSNPAEESDLILWAVDESGSTNSLTFNVDLEYLVLWTELATPTGS